MDWLNIHRSTLASEEFLGCEPTHRATWLCLLAYCADQENGGTIKGADQWGDRKWQQVVRITKAEALDVCPLWSWSGSDLVVWAYPVEKEAEVVRNRENGKRGGRPVKPENNQVVTSGLSSGLSEIEPNGSIPPKRKGKEEEEERKEQGGTGKAPRPARFSPDEFDHLMSPGMRANQAFLQEWHRWVEFRHKKRKRISEDGAKGQIRAIFENGIPAGLAAISKSISSDWTSIHPERYANQIQTSPQHSTAGERAPTLDELIATGQFKPRPKVRGQHQEPSDG